MATVTGKLRFCSNTKSSKDKTIDSTLKVNKDIISGGKIDYKGVNPGKYPPTPGVLANGDGLITRITNDPYLNINQGHTALHNIDIKDKLATDGQIKVDFVNIHTGT